MSKKMTKAETVLLNRILSRTEVCFYSWMNRLSITVQPIMLRKNGAKVMNALIEKGFVQKYSYELTAAGYAYLMTSPERIWREKLQFEIEWKVARRRDTLDHPSCGWGTVQAYSELYKREMSPAEVWQLECERVRQNKILYEQRTQELELQLARYEYRQAVAR